MGAAPSRRTARRWCCNRRATRGGLERKHPGLPLAPGKDERREFEYIRHGTRSFILSRDVVTGQVIAPACGPPRTEADFLAHLQAVVATDPTRPPLARRRRQPRYPALGVARALGC